MHETQARFAFSQGPTLTMTEPAQIICPACQQKNMFRPNARFCQHCGNDIVLNNDDPTDNRRYFITRVIKKGGQGAVYEGIDAEGRVYAIKEMLDRVDDLKERKEALERFNAEAVLLQRLSHPRIPRIYSHFTDEGKHYVTMDFIRGEDLEEIVEREGKLSEERVLVLADQICDVLSYLHNSGYIYRDMKPSNVMIERATGNVKLIDFGIAKNFKPNERGTQIGTPGYAPPEQYQGLATPASDIYALGATLHHMLTGRDPTDNPPFSFPSAINLNPKLSRRTSDALDKALKMKPEERWATVAEFRATLRPLAGQAPQQVRVAQPTVALPGAAAQVGATPAIKPGVPTTRPPQPAPAAPPAPPPPVARPVAPAPPPPVSPASRAPSAAPAAPKQPARRRGGFAAFIAGVVRGLFTLLLMLILLVAGTGVGLYFLAPELLYQTVPWVEQIVPRPTSTAPSLTLRSFETTVEITVPSETSETAILAALREEFARQAKAQLGEATIVNTSSASTVGGFERIDGGNGQSIVRASMRGFVQAP
jgi:tRNA A-37 threonylcarbamoyl transferase component Bud32